MEKLERQTLAPNFWNEAEIAQKVQKAHGQLQEIIKSWEGKWNDLEEIDLLLDMGMEETTTTPSTRSPIA